LHPRLHVWVAATTLVISGGGTVSGQDGTIDESLAPPQPTEERTADPHFEVYGYVKGDLIFDLDSDLGNTIFGLASLDEGAETGPNSRFHAYQSRLELRYTNQTELGTLRARIEGDFFGDGGGKVRLRHAYGAVADVLIGKTWTNFMPIESYPGTVDFQGPAGIPFLLNSQVRYTFGLGQAMQASVSIEEPAGSSDDPAFTAAISISGSSFFLKASALASSAEFGGRSFDAHGVNMSGNAQLWNGGNVLASYTTGEAISSYMVFAGADVTQIGTVARPIRTSGLTLGLTQALNDRLSAGLFYGLRNNDQGNMSDTERLETLHLNLFYKPKDNVTLGLEYIFGERNTFDGTSVSANRIQTSVQFDF
jgi:hypothetical protein